MTEQNDLYSNPEKLNEKILKIDKEISNAMIEIKKSQNEQYYRTLNECKNELMCDNTNDKMHKELINVAAASILLIIDLNI